MSEKIISAMAKIAADEAAPDAAKYIFCNGTVWEIFQEMVDPWQRELKRARKQLSRIGA